MSQFGDLPQQSPFYEQLSAFVFPEMDKSVEQRRWNKLFEQVETRKQNPEKRYTSRAWVFEGTDVVSNLFFRSLHQADLLSQKLKTKEDVDAVFEKIENDPQHSRWYWFMLARSISIPPSEERTMRFHAISDYVAKIIENGAETEEKKKAIFRAGKFLTTFAAKWGAETFLYGLAKTEFSEEEIKNPNNTTLAFLDNEVHPRLYTPLQWFLAARSVWSQYLSVPGNKEATRKKRRYFDSLFTRRFVPEGKRFTIHEGEIYNSMTSFDDYPRGDAMAETDIGVAEDLGLPNTTHVIDMAAGSGRHILALFKRGWSSLVARDASEQFVDALKRKIEELQAGNSITAVVRDWFNPTNEGKKAGLVLLLGRDMPHMVNSYERKKFFRTARTVMEDGAYLVFDIPDITEGQYHTMEQESNPLF